MAKKETKKFIEETMVVMENDLDKIRTAPLMYIARIGSLGAIHLGKEAINNSIDECSNKHSPGENIYLYLDEDSNKFICEDDGRGLPFNNMLSACTKLQSSTKFTKMENQKAAGCNGVGIKATNALSEYFKLEVYKLGEYAAVEFKDGKQIQSGEIKKCKDRDRHGTIITFKPSSKYMGPCQMKSEPLIEWLENIKHFLDKRITIELEVEKKGKIKTYKFKRPTDGIISLLKTVSPSNHTPIYSGKGIDYVDEEVRIIKPGGKVEQKIVKRDVELDFAFALNVDIMEPVTRSFCNFVHTKDEGDHTTAVMDALCEYLSRKTRDVLTEKEKEKFSILYNDIKSALVLILSISTSMNAGFTGQVKEAISNKEMMKPLKNIVKNELDRYFKDNPKELKKYTDVIKANAKARYESTKAKQNVIKREVSVISEHLIPNYFPANRKGKKDYRELFIFEGLSVKANGTQARDPEYQAMYTLRGVPGEAYTQSSSEINETFKNLTRAINAGIGDNFDVTKARFDKVIITSDGDIDGCFIFSLLGGFFLKHMTDLVTSGRLYMSVPPLYKIKDSKTPFVTDKIQYQAVFFRRIVDKFQLKTKKGKVLSKKEMTEFLKLNQYYLDELQRCSDHYSANKKLLEFIIKYRNDRNFNKLMNKNFPEIKIEKDKDNKSDTIIEGVYEGAYQIFTIDKLFDKKTEALSKLMEQNENYYFNVMEFYKDGLEDRGTMSIGEFLIVAQKLQPAIELRYKGLGELSEDDLWDTVMDPEKRTLVQLTISDILEAQKMYDILHGKSKADNINRRLMTEEFEINKDLLDN